MIEKILVEYETLRTTSAVVLVNNSTETDWGQMLLLRSSAVCFLAGRLHFLKPDGPRRSPTHGQMVFYLGDRPWLFYASFTELGVVCL